MNIITSMFHSSYCFSDISQGIRERNKDLLYRGLKNLLHRLMYGYDNSELWNLNDSLVAFLLPRLREFREIVPGYPGNLSSHDEWIKILDEMIWTLEQWSDELPEGFGNWSQTKKKKYYARLNRGWKYIGEYACSLSF